MSQNYNNKYDYNAWYNKFGSVLTVDYTVQNKYAHVANTEPTQKQVKKDNAPAIPPEGYSIITDDNYVIKLEDLYICGDTTFTPIKDSSLAAAYVANKSISDARKVGFGLYSDLQIATKQRFPSNKKYPFGY
jgi:hypothetical protein